MSATTCSPATYSREQALDRLRPEVGDLDALVDRGAGMSYDEVVDYVLEQLAPVPA